MIELERVYDKKQLNGYRILVDRIWPRGMTKEKVAANIWLKEVAPSDGLRKWFGHDPKKWEEFKKRYFKELNNKKGDLEIIRDKEKRGKTILLFGAKDIKHNNAVALKEYLESQE